MTKMPIFRWKLDLCWLFENFCFYWDAWHDSNFENIWSTGSEVRRTSTHTTAVSADMILLVVCFHCSFSTVWHLLSSLMGYCPTWKGQSVQIMDQACPLVYKKARDMHIIVMPLHGGHWYGTSSSNNMRCHCTLRMHGPIHIEAFAKAGAQWH